MVTDFRMDIVQWLKHSKRLVLVDRPLRPLLVQFARGQPLAKHVHRETIRHQGRLNTLCQRT